MIAAHRPAGRTVIVICQRLLACLCLALAATGAYAQKAFQTADEAMTAFGNVISQHDEAGLRALLGDKFRRMIPPVDAEIRSRFLAEWQVHHAVEPVDDQHARIAVGDDGWTLPIPLVRSDKGWQFDTRAGLDEMRARRIGRNELAVIQTMLAVYDAQHDYVQTDHDGSGVLAYARKLASSPGKRDGLYWPTSPGEPPSPLGEAFVRASMQGKGAEGYHGYRFRLLTRQGSHAPGGTYDYVVRGKLFGGFAVIAWPVRYGDTGVKTFMVSHAGEVYESDLGPETASRAEAITAFDPGAGWSKVNPAP